MAGCDLAVLHSISIVLCSAQLLVGLYAAGQKKSDERKSLL